MINGGFNTTRLQQKQTCMRLFFMQDLYDCMVSRSEAVFWCNVQAVCVCFSNRIL